MTSMDRLIRDAARSTRYGELILRDTNADDTPGGQGPLEDSAKPAAADVKVPPEPSALLDSSIRQRGRAARRNR
jgi:hypothetical protein